MTVTNLKKKRKFLSFNAKVTVSYSNLQYIKTPVSSSFTNKITKKP